MIVLSDDVFRSVIYFQSKSSNISCITIKIAWLVNYPHLSVFLCKYNTTQFTNSVYLHRFWYSWNENHFARYSNSRLSQHKNIHLKICESIECICTQVMWLSCDADWTHGSCGSRTTNWKGGEGVFVWPLYSPLNPPQGPFVHLACIIANLMNKVITTVNTVFSVSLKNNYSKIKINKKQF